MNGNHATSHSFCRPACRASWHRKHPSTPRQTPIDFDPRPVVPAREPRAHTPQHNPSRQPGLARACNAILELLRDGQPHAWHELMAVGGARYGARIGEIRAAGHVVIGPRAWDAPGGWRTTTTEPLGPGNVERYRLIVGCA